MCIWISFPLNTDFFPFLENPLVSLHGFDLHESQITLPVFSGRSLAWIGVQTKELEGVSFLLLEGVFGYCLVVAVDFSLLIKTALESQSSIGPWEETNFGWTNMV